MTQIWYDDYNWVSSSGSDLSAVLITANGITGSNWFYTASNTVYPYPQAPTGKWTMAYEAGTNRVSRTITNVYFDSFGRIHY